MSKEKDKVIVVTHDSKFHTDDVFAVAALCIMLEKENPDVEIEIKRTRDKKHIESADYVVDTGDEYNEDCNRFDHHQSGGSGIRDNGIPYASFGLVWKKFGVKICDSKIIADKIDKRLGLPIDARDNGVNISKPIIPGVIPYEIRDLIESFRTTWKENPNKMYDNFIFVMNFAKEVLKTEIKRFSDALEAENIILDIYGKSEDKRLIVFDKYYPYLGFIEKMPELLFVVYPSLSDGNWCVGTVYDVSMSYESRKFFPKSWAGKNNEEFENISGVEGSIFCHNNRFLAVAKTKESAIKLAEIALKQI